MGVRGGGGGEDPPQLKINFGNILQSLYGKTLLIISNCSYEEIKQLFLPFGHFWPNTNFPEKSDSATFYPLYPPNFMQNKLDKSMDPHDFFRKKMKKY